MTTTGWWMVAFGVIVIVFIGYDIFAMAHWGADATFSTKITNAAKQRPIIAFAFGFLFGALALHFFG